ncbi:MAG: hypothetical protein KJZ93_27925, partial [Caldilineaceae bacterium]|nr:hypothetical protein [Caldilineaceae bacterium]
RQTDLAQIAARLADPACRLLTIVGPGGMGKTRLALQAAQGTLEFGFEILDAAAPGDNPKSEIAPKGLPPKFADGVFFVALAGVGSPDLLVSTIAAALDFTFYGSGEPKSQLLDYLKARSPLVVLDNCEHLLAGIELVSDLLAAAPGVKVLATSREPLNLREEWLHPLSGLSYPHDDTHLDDEEAASREQHSALQLFVACARRLQPNFDPRREAPAMAHICRLVEGMPLAVELAATWVKLYPCAQIAQEITRDLSFLTTRLRNVPDRHRSMRAVFEHSWGMLTAADQQIFMRLAVFCGGFRREAAEQVANAMFLSLAALAEKSLLYSDARGRFQMHELLRQFAWEKLNAHPLDREDAQDRHRVFYCRWLARQTERLQGAEHPTALQEIEDEIENIRAAWSRAVAQERLDEIEQALDSLFLFHAAKCWFAEGRALFEQATTALNRDPSISEHTQIVLAQVLIKRTRMQNRLVVEGGITPMLNEAAAAFHQALLWLEPVDLPNAKAEALVGLGSVHASLGDYHQTLWLNEQAAASYERSSNRWGLARTLHNRALMATHLGDYSTAKHYSEEGLALAQTLGDQRLLGDLFQVYSEAHRALGEYSAATRLAEAALAARTAISSQRGIAFALALLGDLAWHTGNYEMAWQYASQSRELFAAIGLTRAGDRVRITLANIACSLGNLSEARSQLRALLLPRLEANDHTWNGIADALVVMAALLVKEGNPRKAVEMVELSLHHPIARQETRDKATQLLADVLALLPPETAAIAQVRGRTTDLRATVAMLVSQETTLDAQSHIGP